MYMPTLKKALRPQRHAPGSPRTNPVQPPRTVIPTPATTSSETVYMAD